jgi:hypothetical protein
MIRTLAFSIQQVTADDRFDSVSAFGIQETARYISTNQEVLANERSDFEPLMEQIRPQFRAVLGPDEFARNF